MKGNIVIAEILKNEYDITDLTPFEEIEYEIEQYSEEVSRVKIQSKTGRRFCCPVYAMFDGYHMYWYGDYGFWGFRCTWKTNVSNLTYNSPYYQLEKLVSRRRTEFDTGQCEKKFLELIKENDWYNVDLTAEQRESFDDFMDDCWNDFVYCDSCLSEIDELCEKLKTLMNATSSEVDWNYRVSTIDLSESETYNIFGCADYELYDIGQKEPSRFFIILYMLSVVANAIKEEEEKGGVDNGDN